MKPNLLSDDLEWAYHLISEFIDGLPQCDCHESYKNRNLIDPSCTYHNAIEDTTYKAMVEWRDKVSSRIA